MVHKEIKKKAGVRVVCALLVTTLAVTTLCACTKKKEPTVGDAKYLKNVGNYSFWDNDAKTAIPEYRIYNHVHDFLDGCTYQDGNAISPDGTVRKVLFLGFDGMRADAVTNILHDENEFDTNGYNAAAQYSGIGELKQAGGIYIGYCGGEKGTDTQQTTSTSASWTAQFTGVWGNQNGVKTNDDSKNLEHKTFMLEFAEKGLQTSVAFDWDQYFDVNLKEEVKYVMDRPELKMTFCDIDRAKAEKPKKTRAETPAFFNFLAPAKPSASAPYDTGMRDHVLDRIAQGDDIVCGIFHNIDSNGHSYEFSNASGKYVSSVRNCDSYAYEILQAVRQREAAHNEEWLVVMANDHGGIGQGHGEQTLEERTTWIASNVKFNEKYFAKGYDGFNVKG